MDVGNMSGIHTPMLCPKGHYCPPGSTSGVPCPAGTFSDHMGLSTEQGCELCPPGAYCASSGLEAPSGFCSPGYLCIHRSVSPQPEDGPTGGRCPAGFYCPEGTSIMLACPVGTFSTIEGATSVEECQLCLAGHYCARAGLSSPSGPCKPGFYCTEGSATATPFINITGYFCLHGSTEPSPVSQPHGDICPPGHFCPSGSDSPQPCLDGSFLPEKGASSMSHCRPCPPGKYCLGPGASRPTGLCSAGFFCTIGASSPAPRANSFQLSCLHEILQEMYLAKMNYVSWMYNMSCFHNSCNTEGDSKWVKEDLRSDSQFIVPHSPLHLKSLHDGKCATYTGDMCPKGFYCPVGSAYPQPCETGSFCNQAGLEAPAGPCAAGHYCPRGSEDPRASLCPAGHYCPLGTALPLGCPLGTIQNSVGGSSAESCRPCPAGHYCHQRGSSEPSGQCADGYYCPPGQNSERPQQHVCPVGHYCEKGSAEPTPCQPGSYQPSQGRGSCEFCPAGFYCQGQGTSFALLCERGFYCPKESATPRPCPAGSYGNLIGLMEARQCSSCDPGMYCRGTGSTFPSGLCAAGFVCIGGASEPSPTDNVTGFSCPPGFFCSAGTLVPQPCLKGTFSEQSGLMDQSQCRNCSPGFYCSETGLSAVSGPCLAGFYCLEGSQTAAPMSSVSGGVCPAGHYCAEGSNVPSPCPTGSFRNETGGKFKDDCQPCLPGFYQDLSGQIECRRCPSGFHCEALRLSSTRGTSSGLSSPLPCPAGFFCPRESPDGRPVPCPKGTYGPSQGLTSEGDCWSGFYCGWGSSKADQTRCPAGFFCPRGTSAPVPCPAGTFSSITGNSHLSNCTECTAGYYCDVEGTVKPTLCLAGYYCPPGMTEGTGLPCPTGTVQNQLGASSIDACLPCPAGLFCSQPGLSHPTGLCEAGYYCPTGSTSKNSSEYQSHSARSHLCLSGYYCPAGTKNPIPCPAGTLSISRGLKTVKDCPPCPPGHFCDRPASTQLSDALPCHAGYVCLGGSSSPAPSDGSHGYRCPAGHGCPVGSAGALPCEPGSYSPASGAAECVLCPRGMMCSSSATSEPAICPLGHYCPVGTALPQPCPLGTFNNQTGAHSHSLCTACPSGSFCSTYGASSPQGSCMKGYFCQSGAMGPTPQNFAENGPCPAGHYCPAGCFSPIPCPLGSFRNTTGGVSLESCSACPAGHYCSAEGLASPTGLCAAGFYCPFDFSSTTAYAFLCPKGHYCPNGSALALPCPSGEYQPNPGSDICIPCRPGFFCEEAILGEPQICPPHSFCPAGTMVPHPCPNGSYSDPNKRGLQEARECLPCPPGRFCRAGRIQGACAAGYLCVYGSADFTPRGSLPDLTQCQWGVQCAGPCPPGFYCPEGAEKAVMCPENTFRSYSGGASAQDCLTCPAGHWCRPGRPHPRLCPAGHYCNSLPGGDSNGWIGPKPCPAHTYRADPGAGSIGDCLPCPPGSHCNSTGLADYSNNPCPPGFWCTGSGGPIFCPAGTKRMLPGAAEPSQCEACAGGTFCPDPQDTGEPNVDGIPCRASYECPISSASEKLCRAGSYCGPQTAEPEICPAGYICPAGSRFYNLPEQLCPFPFYCPANSSSMKSCDGGSKPVNISRLRGSKKCCCSICEGGTYRPYLSTLFECLPCPPGYFCPPGTEDYKSNSCPEGYVCPTGSTQPTPCLPGSFGNLTKAQTLGDCHPCPPNTFNHLHARRACFPCGSSSTSPPGSSSCSCTGKNRSFQRSDGACLCRTGFIFYNEVDFKSSTSDSALDCQPELYKRCAPRQVRLAASRECVSPSLYSCNVTCGPDGGTLDVEMGICHCQRYVSAEELCNTSCLSKMPQLSAHVAPDGQLLLSVKEKDGTVWVKTLVDVLGPDPRAMNIGKVHLVQFDAQGVFGWIPKQREDIEIFLSESIDVLAPTWKKRTTGDNEDDLPVLPRIPNPVACLSTGDMLIFHLTINHTDRSLSHFPFYEKDHLFNSNPSWDFGVFRRVQTLIKQSNLNNTWFAHAFWEAGKYVFLDSAVPDWSLVVVVSEDGTECDPRAPAFQATTPAHLIKCGVIKKHRLNHLPDWGTIAGLLSLLFVVVVAVTTTVVVLWPNNAKLVSQWRTKPKWRSLGEPPRPPDCSCSEDSLAGSPGSRGVGEGAEAEEPTISKGGMVSGRCDLEEFNVKTLYDKLEDQNLHVASQLARHRKDTQEFYRNINQQVDALQNVFVKIDGKKLHILKQLLASQNATKDNPYNKTVKNRNDEVGESAALLEAVLRSVETLLYKMNQETWQTQDQPFHLHSHSQEHERQAQNSNETTLVSPIDLTQMEALCHDAMHSKRTAPCLSDVDLAKLVSISPLYKTLQEIHQSLQNPTPSHPIQPLPNVICPSSQENPKVQLIPTALDSLSPPHSAVFLFGCRVMELLEKCLPLPSSVLLTLTKSLPLLPACSDNCLLAHCRGDFYFDAGHQVLYLSEAKLEHVGQFIAIVLQSMVHVASGNNAQSFMQALHDAISALSLQLFSLSFKQSTAEGALSKEFIDIRVPKGVHFTDLLDARVEKYKHPMLEQFFANLSFSTTEETQTVLPTNETPMEATCVEEEIDRMNEAFLEISRHLQSRGHVSKTEKEEEDQSVRSALPSLSRNEALLLDLKRRYISQRLDELQITLERIGRQRPGSVSSAGTHEGSGTTQRAPLESYAGTEHL
ncbi:zonadhesin [Syngnathus acus]|uniref:zonadhesin n=1 Tax=Syngnathus acus TaxID=161584 RepID=UPI00188603E2|nr:zonadhesin [Syngnathus acus]